MAKGRQLTSSRSERWLGSYNSFNDGGGGANDSDLREDDVWESYGDSFNEEARFGNGSLGEWGSRAAAECNENINRYSPPPRGDHKHHRQVGGLSLAFDESDGTTTTIVHQYRGHESVPILTRGHHLATSAPVNVPDWSKIYRVDSVESMHNSDDDREMEWLPPHEHAAREHARSRRTTAGSVFEGVGRTLKGRDLSRVRDAVWSQTGFDG